MYQYLFTFKVDAPVGGFIHSEVIYAMDINHAYHCFWARIDTWKENWNFTFTVFILHVYKEMNPDYFNKFQSMNYKVFNKEVYSNV